MRTRLPLARRRRSGFDAPPTPLEQQLVPVLSVLAGSLVSLLPIIATQPLLPPLGFLMLVAWRLLRAGLWPAWAGLPLGLFDDLASGQPLGSAMAVWTLALLAIDLVETQLVWRDYWQDWGVAALLTCAYILLGALIVRLTGGAIAPLVLVPQMLASILVFPLCVRIAAGLDDRRGAR